MFAFPSQPEAGSQWRIATPTSIAWKMYKETLFASAASAASARDITLSRFLEYCPVHGHILIMIAGLWYG